MPDSTAVLTAFRDELELADLIRRPSAAGPLPPMHVEPAKGPPAPGEREAPEDHPSLVVTLRLSTEGSVRAGAAFIRTIIADVIYRSTGTAGLKAGRALDAAIRARLVQTAGYGTGITLAEGTPTAMHVLELAVFGGLGPVDIDGDVRTDQAKYSLEVLA